MANATLGSDKQKAIIFEAIKLLKEAGLYPVSVIMDQHPTNVKMAQHLGVTAENPTFSVENTTIVLLYDTPHLFKSIRNNLLIKNILLNDEIISFKYIRDLYHSDLARTPRLAPHLIRKAVYPTTFERMNVKLATRTLSRTTAKALETSVSLGYMSTDALPTSEFINQLDQFFDACNSKFISETQKVNIILLINSNIFIGFVAF